MKCRELKAKAIFNKGKDMTTVFERTKKRDLCSLIDLLDEKNRVDKDLACRTSDEFIRSLRNSNSSLSAENELTRIERIWYSSLEDAPDYSVYDDPYYICDIWSCWVVYSRPALSKLMRGGWGNLDGGTKMVLDLGCGFGYTTAALKEVFSSEKAVGTNLENTFQFDLASKIGNDFGFEVRSESNDIGRVDVVCALEYFEHIQNPIDHLNVVVESNRPRLMVINNSFDTRSIGHFKKYSVDNESVGSSKMSRKFNSALRKMGYTMLKTGFWNNRPSLWVNR